MDHGAYAILEEELGAAPEQVFGTFEIEPLAAASTAQVHRATLISGELVRWRPESSCTMPS